MNTIVVDESPSVKNLRNGASSVHSKAAINTSQGPVLYKFMYSPFVIPDTDPPTPGYQPTIQVTIPTTASGLLPRGYYMLYLLTNQDVPSVATWVKVS